jgi:hypothetical protein
MTIEAIIARVLAQTHSSQNNPKNKPQNKPNKPNDTSNLNTKSIQKYYSLTASDLCIIRK